MSFFCTQKLHFSVNKGRQDSLQVTTEILTESRPISTEEVKNFDKNIYKNKKKINSERILRGVISTRHQRNFVSGLNYTAQQIAIILYPREKGTEGLARTRI